MKLVIDILDDTYDSIMSRDWKNSGWLYSEEWKAIHDGIPLDKIRAEIHATAEMHEDGDYYLRDEWIDEIIDKYREGKG